MTTETREATLEDFRSCYSDMYKEAYGVRPRNWETGKWSIQEWEKEFDRLDAEIKYNEEREAEEQAEAATQVEATISKLIAMGAKDRATAIRWLHDANNTDGDDEYLCYNLGLKYGYFRHTA